MFYEKPRRLPSLVGVILHTTSHCSTKGEPAYDRLLSGYFPLAVAFCSKTIAQGAIATRDGGLNAPFLGTFLNDLENHRANGARSRNLRLTAIRSFFRYAALEFLTTPL